MRPKQYENLEILKQKTERKRLKMDEQKQKIKKPHKKMSNKLFTGIWGSLLAS